MAALATLRAIHFAFAIQVIGALLFCVILNRAPAGATGWARDRFVRLAAVSAVAVVVSEIAWLVLQAADMADSGVLDVWTSGALGALMLKTRAGIIWWGRLALALAVIVAVGAAGRTTNAALTAIGFALAVASSVSGAWLSHAAADPGPYGTLHLAVHAAHMLGAALWLGGFVPLLMLLWRARRSRDPKDLALARHAAVWFGNIALLAVGVLVATGMANTAFAADSAADLTVGPFARLLAGKVVLFLVMLALAAHNRQRLVPQLAAASASAVVATRLWRNVLAELALGILILVLAGALGLTPPGEGG